MSLRDERIIFIDCQTTGANPDRGNLLEIAWSISSAANMADEVHTYLVEQPELQSVPHRIKALTGITDEDMQNAVAVDAVRYALTACLAELPSPALCVAHFARFEQPFLTRLFADGGDEKTDFDLLCTYEISRRLFPNLPSKGIRAVAGYFGASCGEMKRARCHVEATGAIWRGLVDPLAALGISSASQLREWIITQQAPKCTRFEYPLPKERRLALSETPGVYRMKSKNGDILYVGKATSLRNRVNSYFRGQKGKDSKTKELLSQVWDLEITQCATPLEAALLEADEIKRWDPPYNRVLKARKRTLIFYSPDFASASNVQDSLHRLGPFPGAQALQPLLSLTQSLSTRSFTADIFFYDFPASLLYDGFELFCINEGLEASQIINARSLLAIGLWLYRRQLRNEHLALLEAENQADELSEGENQTQEKEIDDSMTVEYVAGKYERLLRHTARLYLRSKSLTELLHSDVRYTHKGVEHALKVINGSVLRTHENIQAELQENIPWFNLDVSTYDRMSVLLSELNKLRNRRTPLQLEQSVAG